LFEIYINCLKFDKNEIINIKKISYLQERKKIKLSSLDSCGGFDQSKSSVCSVFEPPPFPFLPFAFSFERKKKMLY